MKKRDAKDLALAIMFHVLEGSGTEFEGSSIDNTDEVQEIWDYINKERVKLMNRISQDNINLVGIRSIPEMVEYVKRGIPCQK